MSTRSVVAFAAAAVAATTALTALESVLDAPAWTPDAIEHAGIAHALCNGRGFVDPIHFNYSIDARVPVPAFAVRPPLVPLLLAIPICLGATLTGASALHGLWAGLVAGGAVLVAARWMSLSAAVAAVLLISATFWWRFVAATPLTEVTTFAALLLLLVTLPGALHSLAGAFACAAATALVWLARPNLGVAAVAVVGVMFWRLGFRCIRSRVLWAYAGALMAIVGAIHVAAAWLTGFAPYESGAVFGQILEVSEASRYGHVYPPRLEFVTENWDAIARILHSRLGAFWQSLFVSDVLLRVGWVAVPSIAFTLLRRDQAPEAVFCGLLAILLSAVAVTNYSFFEPRYLLFPAILGILVAVPLAERTAHSLGERLAEPAARRLPRLGLYVVIALLVIPSLPGPSALRTISQVNEARLRPPPERRHWCRFPVDAIVATDMPWRVHLWCGNAAVMIPHNAAAPGVLQRFFAEQHVGYVLLKSSRGASYRLLRNSKDLRPVAAPSAANDLGALFEVIDAKVGGGWNAPGALERTGFAEPR